MGVVYGILLAVIAVLLFGFMIFFHELGHFLTAKLSGIKVNEFALGMGPKLFSFQRGETRYALRLLPIGGFCAMEGENDNENPDERSFGSRPIWRRMIVIVAGSVMNILLGFILLVIVNAQTEVFATAEIARFSEESALSAAGIEVGDVIKEIDGYAIYGSRDLTFALGTADPESVDFEVERGGERLAFNGVKMNFDTNEDGSKILRLDFSVLGEERTFFNVLSNSAVDTLSMARMVFESIKGIITGRFGFNDLAGPVGTAQAISQVASAGLELSFADGLLNVLFVMALITVNLGVVNMLPLPALDGGRFVFLLIEAIFRKPVPAKYEGYVNTVGIVLLLILMVAVTANDILRLLGFS